MFVGDAVFCRYCDNQAVALLPRYCAKWDKAERQPRLLFRDIVRWLQINFRNIKTNYQSICARPIDMTAAGKELNYFSFRCKEENNHLIISGFAAARWTQTSKKENSFRFGFAFQLIILRYLFLFMMYDEDFYVVCEIIQNNDNLQCVLQRINGYPRLGALGQS